MRGATAADIVAVIERNEASDPHYYRDPSQPPPPEPPPEPRRAPTIVNLVEQGTALRREQTLGYLQHLVAMSVIPPHYLGRDGTPRVLYEVEVREAARYFLATGDRTGARLRAHWAGQGNVLTD